MPTRQIEKCIYYDNKSPNNPYIVIKLIKGERFYSSFSDLKSAKKYRNSLPIEDIKICVKCKLNGDIITDYYVNNSKCKNCTKKRNNSVISYYHTIVQYLTFDEEPMPGFNNELEVKCWKCKKYFMPSNISVQARVQALKGNISGESHLYCSQLCKDTCNTYHQGNQYKHQIPLSTRARCNQHIDKKALIDNQIDQYGYTFCEKCGLKINNLHIHHNLMVSKYPTETDNIAH